MEFPIIVKLDQWSVKSVFIRELTAVVFSCSLFTLGSISYLQDMSALRRSNRQKSEVNYRALNKTGKKEMDFVDDALHGEEELDYSEADVSEMESCEDSEHEDGEISSSESEEEEMLEKSVRNKDVEKLKEILKASKEDVMKLQKQVKKEKEKDAKKNKEIKDLLKQIKETNKHRSSLQQSLASSKNSSPQESPVKKKPTRKPKSDIRKVISRNEKKAGTKEKGKSEYKDTLSSLLKLKQGDSDDYAELVVKAMEATDNILALKKLRNDNSDCENSNEKSKKVKSKSNIGKKKEVKTTTEALKNLSQDSNEEEDNNESVNALMTAIEKLSIHGLDTEAMFKNASGCDNNEFAEKLLRELRECKQNKTTRQQHNKGNNPVNKLNDEKKKEDEDEEMKGKKVVSGKCAKPDEADIKRSVKFAHERLDPRHTTTNERGFDKLSFHLLIAGELELITRKGIEQDEMEARLSILKTLCYHKKYLEDKELRDGYDQMMKRIERGTHEWDMVLGEHLHEYLAYRANVLLREKMVESQQTGFTKVETKKQQNERKGNHDIRDGAVNEKIIYCQDYNSRKCKFRDHHEGRFSGQKVTRFHICKRCHQTGAISSHREGDENCPLKEA